MDLPPDDAAGSSGCPIFLERPVVFVAAAMTGSLAMESLADDSAWGNDSETFLVCLGTRFGGEIDTRLSFCSVVNVHCICFGATLSSFLDDWLLDFSKRALNTRSARAPR